MSRPKALEAFRFLDADEQRLARAASPLHCAECEKAKRKSLDAHKLIGEKFWLKYPHARISAAPAAQAVMRRMEGDELAGLKVAVRMAEQRELLVKRDDAGEFVMSRKPELQRDIAALAPFANVINLDAWPIVERWR